MGGSSVVSDGWEFTAGGNRTVVLVGRTGDGKSSTGNSILGRKEFRSMPKSSGVTSTCELKSTRLPDGTVLDVIDTPGLFDFSADQVTVGNEIVKCVDLAKDGIHAVLLVLSVRSRFSREEQAAVHSFLDFFGNKITDYMILVFTGGDDLEETDVTFEDYLGTDCPELEEMLCMCENRYVLFDNRTKDPTMKAKQLGDLIFQVNLVVEKNGGKPYTNKLFNDLKEEAKTFQNQKTKIDSSVGYTEEEVVELKRQMQRSYDEQVKRITEAVESQLKVSMQRLEEQLAEERASRLEAEKDAKEAQKKSDDHNRELKDRLESSRREIEELRNRCIIL